MDRLHVERVTEHKGAALAGTEIGEPVPAEDAPATHDQARTVGFEGAKQDLVLTAEPLVQAFLAVRV